MAAENQKSEMVSPKQNDAFDHEAYANITIAAKLLDIKLVASEYMIKPEVFEALDDINNMGFFGEPSAFHFDIEDGILIGNYRWTAEVKLGRKKVLKLSSEYLVAYTGLEGKEEHLVEFFFKKVGRFATYPYFRSDFSHHSSASGISLPPLPSLNERIN